MGAALRRGDRPGQVVRRSEIGSHTPPKTAIFIGVDELEKVMGHFYEIFAWQRDKAALAAGGLCLWDAS